MKYWNNVLECIGIMYQNDVLECFAVDVDDNQQIIQA